MTTRKSLFITLWLSSSVLANPSAEFPQAISVSPGGVKGPTWLTDPCPTFSWGSVPDAVGYELAVFWAQDGSGLSHDEQAELGDPILASRITASALSWTPDSESCLQEGGRYLWFVRAMFREGAGPWSDGRQFEVDMSGGILIDAVRKEVSIQLSKPDTWNRVVREVLSTNSADALRLTSIGTLVRETEPVKLMTAVESNIEVGVTPESQVGIEKKAQRIQTFPNPSAFRVSNESGVVFDGPSSLLGQGSIPVEGGGGRFMWYPSKRALRAGHVNSTRWDDTSIGNYSVAVGNNTEASGSASTAMGRYSIASGFNATAMGSYATASGNYSTAMGGSDDGTTASGHYSTAMGRDTIASGESSTAIGYATRARSFAETVIGAYNVDVPAISTSSWHLSDQLFVVGKGADSSLRSDALVIWKDGHSKFYGTVAVEYASGPTNTGVCRSFGSLAVCSSSARYKEEVAKLPLGLETVERLNPVTFKWKEHEEYDLGFVAEEVAEVDPLLATYNDVGEIEGVKYRQLTAVLVNAIKEQQEQMEEQREQIASLKAIVCQDHPEAAVCL